MNLNQSPTNGRPGDLVAVVASLTDVSSIPPAPVPNAAVELAIAGDTCSAQTNASGVASCQITLGPAGAATLMADFAGTAQLLESSASVGFGVVGAVGAPCEPSDCADTDPCTADVCNDGQCQHTAPAGYDGATCYLAAATDALNTAAATDLKKKTKSQLLRKLAKIGTLVGKARGGGKKGAKALKKSKSQLAKLEKKLGKLEGKKVMPPLADRLILFVGGAKTALGQV